MVKFKTCVSAFFLALILSLPFCSRAADLSNYHVGDKAAEDIVTPVGLVVVDPVATEALKERESSRMPVVFRYVETPPAMAEEEILSSFANARSNFLILAEQTFGQPKLEEEAIDTEEFDKLIAGFRKKFKAFPLTREIARQWARGEGGLVVQTSIIVRVREAISQPMRYDSLTNAPKFGAYARIVKISSNTEPLTLEDVQDRGRTILKTNLLNLTRARQLLLSKFSPNQQEYGKYAGQFLRPNCFVDSELTLQGRERHVEPLLAADTYQAGQTVVTQGQIIDRKMMAAIAQLQEKTAAGRLQQQVEQQQQLTESQKQQVAQQQEEILRNQRELASKQQQVELMRQKNRWTVTGLGAVVVALALGIWRVARSRRQSSTLLPATLSANMAFSVESGETNPWEQRAIEAEAKAERAQEAIRQGVLEQLREKVVTGLASQRSDLLDAQQTAAAEMAELEKRLNELHAPLQERLHTYERRIADLEKQLAAKDQENIELIKAKIDLMRKQLEAEKAKDSLRFN